MTKRANDGTQALELLREFSLDVALLDLGLPTIDGYELAQRIRQIPHLGRCKLVATTGYGEEPDRTRSRAARPPPGEAAAAP